MPGPNCSSMSGLRGSGLCGRLVRVEPEAAERPGGDADPVLCAPASVRRPAADEVHTDIAAGQRIPIDATAAQPGGEGLRGPGSAELVLIGQDSYPFTGGHVHSNHHRPNRDDVPFGIFRARIMIMANFGAIFPFRGSGPDRVIVTSAIRRHSRRKRHCTWCPEWGACATSPVQRGMWATSPKWPPPNGRKPRWDARALEVEACRAGEGAEFVADFGLVEAGGLLG